MATIDVLVVDDSPFMQRIITKLLETDPRIRVVGTAADGYQALEQIRSIHPDVVTMDIEMPRLDGLATLHRLMQQMPTPVIMLSGVDDATAAVQALELGAVDFVAKPSGTVSIDLYKIGEELIAKVKIATLVNLDRVAAQVELPAAPVPAPGERESAHCLSLVAIGASTGGPRALDWILRHLPASLPASVLVVQHMPAGFTAGFAQRLDLHSPLQVTEAGEGQVMQVGSAYVAPGGKHMVVTEKGGQPLIRLLATAAVNSVRPSADVLMASVAEVANAHSVGVVLTGMGKDGSEGLARIKQAQGITLAQNRESSTIFGMPRAAIEQGVVDKVLPLSEIPAAIVEAVEGKRDHG